MRSLRRVAMLVVVVVLLCPAAQGQAQNNRPRPDAALARLERERGTVRSRVDASGTVRLLEGDLEQGTRGAETATARRFFARYGDIFGLTDPASELTVVRVDHDGRGYASVRFGQRYRGITVEDGDIRADVDRAGTLRTVHGALVPFLRPRALQPTITGDEAARRTRTALGGTLEGAPHLAIVRAGAVDHLAWIVVVRTAAPALWRVRVDAQTGTEIDRLQTLAADKNIQTYDAEGGDELPGVLRRRWPEPSIADADIDAAHDNAVAVYDYYRENFGRDSIDGAGLPIVSTVHFLRNYNNAYWDPGQLQIVYGDGDGSTFAPLARSLDVVAHELTHGVTQFSAQLSYARQSGALNESFSDIFGALIDTSNWDIAESVYTPDVPGDALRSLQEPTRYGQPGVLGEYIELPNTWSGDNGGVHLNSGIFNHAAYQIAERLGRPKLAQIAYRTLTMKLTSTSDFADARDLTVQACDELIDPPVVPAIAADDCQMVRHVFLAAGWDAPPSVVKPYRAFAPLIVNGLAVCTPDLVRNGDFEDGEIAWPNTGSVYGSVIERWDRVQSGIRSALIEDDTQVLQLVRRDVPGALRLSFSIYKDAADDTLLVAFENPRTYDDLREPMVVGADAPVGAWTTITLDAESLPDDSSFRLVFRHGEGGSVYIDDVALEQDCTP